MRKTILALCLVGMLLAVTGLSMARGRDSGVAYYTEVKGDVKVSIDQIGHRNVYFENMVRIGRGSLDFDQDIIMPCGRFSNDVRLNGRNLKFDNIAEQSRGTISFEQGIYAGESSSNGDEVASKQVFSKMTEMGRRYIAQEVIVHPTNNAGHECEPDSLKMRSGEKGQFGMMTCGPESMAMLGQKGKATGDYIFAEQRSNIGGFSKSTIESFNSANWLKFEQMLMFSSMGNCC